MLELSPIKHSEEHKQLFVVAFVSVVGLTECDVIHNTTCSIPSTAWELPLWTGWRRWQNTGRKMDQNCWCWRCCRCQRTLTARRISEMD